MAKEKKATAAADIITETAKDVITDTEKDAITDMTAATDAAAIDNRYLYILG